MGGTECCKMTSFGVVELIRTCVASFVGPTMLGVMVLRDILAEMGDFFDIFMFLGKTDHCGPRFEGGCDRE